MMNDVERASLRRCMDLLQELLATDVSASRPSLAQSRRHDARRREVLRQLKRHGQRPCGRSGPRWLHRLCDGNEFEDRELVVLLGLLHRRITGPSAAIGGREILGLLGDGPVDLIEHAPLLQTQGRLRKLGLVEARAGTPDPALDGTYRLSERVYQRVFRALHGVRPPRKPSPSSAYRSAAEHFAALRELVVMHERRAAILFPRSVFSDEHQDVLERADDLTDAICDHRTRMLSREAATPPAVRLPLVALRKACELSDAEEVIVLELLFREFLHGYPIMLAAELTRLVSASENDVIVQRRLLASDGRLVAGGIIGLESEIDDKPMLASAYLQGWVTEKLVDGKDLLLAFTSQDQARFHAYLERLDDSSEFYRNL